MFRFAMRSFARSPARWFGGASSAIIMLCASINVAFMQDGKHPAPLRSSAQVQPDQPAPVTTAATNPAPALQQRPIPLPIARAQPRPIAKPGQTTEQDAIASFLSDNDSPGADAVADVRLLRIQTELQTLGYYSGDLDGLKGPQTQAAIEAFQRKQKLPVTGEASDTILARLQDPSAPAARVVKTKSIRLNETQQARTEQASLSQDTAQTVQQADPKVQALQRILSELGYAPGPVDGLLGGGTRSAIEAFEADRGMVPTGVISPDVIRVLEDFSGQTVG